MVKVIQNGAQYPLHHVTYAPVKFEAATSNGLGGDAFTRKYFLLHKTSPSTLYTMSSMRMQSLKLLCPTVKGRCIYFNLQENTFFDIGPGHMKHRPVPSTSCDLYPAKFEVATSNGLGEDTITRKVTDGRTDRRTDDGPGLVQN